MSKAKAIIAVVESVVMPIIIKVCDVFGASDIPLAEK